MKSLLVYCGSRAGDNPRFIEAAQSLGKDAAARGWRIVYGGGNLGLMGATAAAARDAGGDVFGIIPEFLVDREGVLDGVRHTIVQSMHERKMMMFEEADAIVTLPGGIGTLEEVVETVSWARLQLHRKPIIMLNIDNFWTPFHTLLEHIVQKQFADEELMDDFVFVDAVADVIPAADEHLLRTVA